MPEPLWTPSRLQWKEQPQLGYTMLVFALLLTAQIAPQSADLPNRQPQLATDGTRLVLTYGVGDSVFFADSRDAARVGASRQSSPRRANSRSA